MTDEIEARSAAIAEARAFYMAAPFMVPLLQKRKDSVFKQLMAAQRDNRRELYDGIVAQLFALDSLELEIRQRDLEYRTLEENNNGKRN